MPHGAKLREPRFDFCATPAMRGAQTVVATGDLARLPRGAQTALVVIANASLIDLVVTETGDVTVTGGIGTGSQTATANRIARHATNLL